MPPPQPSSSLSPHIGRRTGGQGHRLGTTFGILPGGQDRDRSRRGSATLGRQRRTDATAIPSRTAPLQRGRWRPTSRDRGWPAWGATLPRCQSQDGLLRIETPDKRSPPPSRIPYSAGWPPDRRAGPRRSIGITGDDCCRFRYSARWVRNRATTRTCRSTSFVHRSQRCQGDAPPRGRQNDTRHRHAEPPDGRRYWRETGRFGNLRILPAQHSDRSRIARETPQVPHTVVNRDAGPLDRTRTISCGRGARR